MVYKTIDSISVGAYGIILKVQDSEGTERALKCGMKNKQTTGSSNIKELTILKNYPHPHIVKCPEYRYDTDVRNVLDQKGIDILQNILNRQNYQGYTLDEIYLLMELAESNVDSMLFDETLIDSGSEDGNLIDRRSKLVKPILLHVLLALEFLHCNSIVHLDIKLDNILKFGNTYKLCDMGMSSYVDQDTLSPFTSYHPDYRPPEIYAVKLLNKRIPLDLTKSDIWAVGMLWVDFCIAKNRRYNIFGRNNLNGSFNRKEHRDINRLVNMLLHDKLNSQNGIEWYRHLDSDRKILKYYDEFDVNQMENQLDGFPELIKNMLHIDPDQRYSASQALNHEYFSEYREYIRKCRDDHLILWRSSRMTKSIYNINMDLYNDEIFTAERLFNEYMNLRYKDREVEEDMVILIRYTCWYMMYKMHRTMDIHGEFPISSIPLNNQLKDSSKDEIIEIVRNIEYDILRTTGTVIYRVNLKSLLKDRSIENLERFMLYINNTSPGEYKIDEFIRKYEESIDNPDINLKTSNRSNRSNTSDRSNRSNRSNRSERSNTSDRSKESE